MCCSLHSSISIPFSMFGLAGSQRPPAIYITAFISRRLPTKMKSPRFQVLPTLLTYYTLSSVALLPLILPCPRVQWPHRQLPRVLALIRACPLYPHDLPPSYSCTTHSPIHSRRPFIMSSLDTNSVISLHHFVAIILIVAPLSAILLLIISVLLFFTPTESRRRPVFILNILACFLGTCQAVYFACLNSYVILHPDKPVSHTLALAGIAILLGPPIFIDGISFVRILAFYLIRVTPPSTLFTIFTPTFLWKAACLGCLTAFLVTYPIACFNGPSYATLSGLVWGRGPWIVALLALQVADNSYISHLTAYICIFNTNRMLAVSFRHYFCIGSISMGITIMERMAVSIPY